MTAVEIEIITS